MAFTVPKLPYDYSALEPSIDTTTMQIHHGKHHQVGGNAAIALYARICMHASACTATSDLSLSQTYMPHAYRLRP